MTATPVETLDAYADHLGIPRRDPNPTEFGEGEPLWDGAAMLRLPRAEDAAHEIAHWLLASPERRGFVDYGWGWDYQWVGMRGLRDPSPYLRLPAAEDEYVNGHEEVQACVLGFAFLLRVGFTDVDLLWDDYCLRETVWDEAMEPDGTRIEPEVLRARREVQPHVEAFTRWLHHR